jgi:hypothetical protein
MTPGSRRHAAALASFNMILCLFNKVGAGVNGPGSSGYEATIDQEPKPVS